MSRLRNRHLFASDAMLLAVAPFLVYALRFEGVGWGRSHIATAFIYTALMVPICLSVFRAFGMYSRLWRYASVGELQTIFGATTTATILCVPLGGWILPTIGLTPARVPFSVLFTLAVLTYLIVAAPRLVWRMGGVRALVISIVGRPDDEPDESRPRRVLIAGAGDAGHLLIREIRSNPELGLVPVAFLDDDREKLGQRLSNLPVLGPLANVSDIIRRYGIDELIIALPRATGDIVRPLVRAALDAGIKTRTVPGYFDVIAGKPVGELREIGLEDLLRRAPVTTDLAAVSHLTTGRTVLVTGAGGSIGSELARQIAALDPARLVILGHGENPIFHIQNELRERFPALAITAVIADVRDRRRMLQVMAQHRPYAVFHAAAHKHVPLMEENVVEAVSNNVRGTQNVVHAAVAAGVENFVLISTDKAVRPTSVMGTSKRVAEHVVRQAAREHGRNYVAVRFGNVLGSQGSVVPTFVEQIRKGGPVMVTHPEMRRYFMTIPEAVQLVLQAGAMGKGGELFVLDMGQPVKIVDLASDLIRLSGFEPGVDIAIEFSGMRPGEKLYEEMFWGHEHATPTDHPKILCSRDPLDASEMELIEDLIRSTLDQADELELRRKLHRIVPDAMWSPDGTPIAEPVPVGSVGVASLARAHDPVASEIALLRRSGEQPVPRPPKLPS